MADNRLYVIGVANLLKLRSIATTLYIDEVGYHTRREMAEVLDAICDNAIEMPLEKEADRG
jgi:hypothetical protein